MSTVSAIDVAKHILAGQSAPMTTMKLQKLVYYSQAWHLAWTGKPLFDEQIQAWANGPVVYSLFKLHKGKYSISDQQMPLGNPAKLTAAQKDVIGQVVASYGKLTASQLSMLTHAEDPWKLARGAAGPGENSTAPIDPAAMQKFYGSLQHTAGTVDPADAFSATP